MLSCCGVPYGEEDAGSPNCPLSSHFLQYRSFSLRQAPRQQDSGVALTLIHFFHEYSFGGLTVFPFHLRYAILLVVLGLGYMLTIFLFFYYY